MTPAGRLKTSHGNRWATVTRAIRKALRVTAVANQGYAMTPMPSPRLEMVEALKSLR